MPLAVTVMLYSMWILPNVTLSYVLSLLRPQTWMYNSMLPQGSEIKSFNLMQWNGKGVWVNVLMGVCVGHGLVVVGDLGRKKWSMHQVPPLLTPQMMYQSKRKWSGNICMLLMYCSSLRPIDIQRLQRLPWPSGRISALRNEGLGFETSAWRT
jgi:hypothetical protein